MIRYIYVMKEPPVNAWNIGMENDKYGYGLAKTRWIDKYCILNSIRTKLLKK